jgi:hypothetical protein
MAPAKKLDWTAIDPSRDFRYSAPKPSGTHGGFSVNVDVCDASGVNQRFVHQAPPLALPFGISRKATPEGGERVTASFSFPTVRMDPTTGEYHGEETTLQYLKFLLQIEELNRKKAFEQCKTFFKKAMAQDVIDEFYFKSIYASEKVRSGEYSPTFTAKVTEELVSKAGGEVGEMELSKRSTTFFSCNDAAGEIRQATLAEVGRPRKVVPLLESTGMWFAGKQFGMQFRVLQMLFFEEDQLTGFAIDMGAAAEYTLVARPLALKREAEGPAEDPPAAKAAAFNLPVAAGAAE